MVFDFDGTISTLRHGWETIMEPLMIEMIGGGQTDDGLVRMVREYIDASTGIQTIYQMQWLADKVLEQGKNKSPLAGPWEYKEEYNRRLMLPVSHRIAQIKSGEKTAGDFLIAGSGEFLRALGEAGIEIYVASGTDHPDVVNEAECLGVSSFFTQIAGAPVGRADCSKEAVLKMLMQQHGLAGEQVAVFGDGKVEIMLGRENNMFTVGLATDEEVRSGVNPVKRTRLINAGAHIITGDFADGGELLKLMGIGEEAGL